VIVDKGKGAQVILADLKRPICRIPQLAIHLNRKVNDKGGQLNAQKHLPPVLGLGDEKMSKGLLESMLAKACGVTRKSILDYTLDLYDTQAPGFGGLKDEFYFSGRIDNLAGCFSAVEALVEAPDAEDVNSVIALFDNEEIGSGTFVGAGSTLLDTVFERLCMNDARPRESLLRALSKTILVSSDGAHAVHPNYADMHDKHHHVQLNGGPVIKVHAKQKYASTAETSAYFMNCAKRADAPCQVFANRSDLLSGSTIGPISSTRLGVPAVDAGVPMLSMHSIREMGGVDDLEWMKRILIAHFTDI
jgi:aspartyl aminopeptidase